MKGKQYIMARKILVNANVDYVMGHLSYGHYEGVLELSDEEYEEFVENPIKFCNENDIHCDLTFLLDAYGVDEIGDINAVDWREI